LQIKRDKAQCDSCGEPRAANAENRIGDEGCKAIAEGLKVDTALQLLRLDGMRRVLSVAL
jgi:hypothetical protein